MEKEYHIHHEVRESIVVLIAKILWMQILMTVFHILMNTILWKNSWEVRELLIFHLIVTMITIYLILKWLTTFYSLHEAELICENWIVNKIRNITKLDQNTDISYSQNVLQRLCWFGNIMLKNQYTEWKTILKNISNAEYYIDLIKQQCYQSDKKQNNIPT